MEWCDGGNLMEWIVGDRFANMRGEAGVYVMLSIMYALVASKSKGINIHRDIKP